MLSLIDAMHPYLIHPPPFDVRVPHNNAIRNSVTTGEFSMFVGGVIGRLMKFQIKSGRHVGIFVQIFKHRSEIDSLDLDDEPITPPTNIQTPQLLRNYVSHFCGEP